MTEEEALELLRRKVEEAGSQRAFAKAYNVDRVTVCLILGAGKKDKKITPQILRALGLRKVTTYEPA